MTAVNVRPLADDLREYDDVTPRSQQSDVARAEGKLGLGPSDYARCRAQIGYRERPPVDYVPDPITKDAAIVGTLIHEGIQRRRAELYPDREYDVEIPLPGLDQPGHADEYDPASATLVDFKTAGDWVWDRVSTGRVDGMPGDWGQLAIYALGLRAAGRPVERLRLVYLWREKGLTVEFERPYDEDEAIEALSWLHDVSDALDAGEPPGSARLPRDRKGPGLDPICAKHCPAVRHCWMLDEVPEGRSPQSFVIVGADVEKAAAVLADFHEAYAVAAKAVAVRDEHKTTLHGLPEGVYPGGLMLEWSGGSPGRWADDPVDSVRVLRAALAEQRAALLESQWRALLDADEVRDPTDDERAAWAVQAADWADALALPQKLVGKRAASPKVSRVNSAPTVAEIPL